jgi:hypothetical protein
LTGAEILDKKPEEVAKVAPPPPPPPPVVAKTVDPVPPPPVVEAPKVVQYELLIINGSRQESTTYSKTEDGEIRNQDTQVREIANEKSQNPNNVKYPSSGIWRESLGRPV